MCEREGERERDTRAHTHTSFVVFVGEFAQVIVLYARTYTHVIYCGIRCASDLNYTHTQLWDKRPNQRARGSPDPPGRPPPRRPPRTVAHPRGGSKVTNRRAVLDLAANSHASQRVLGGASRPVWRGRLPGSPWAGSRPRAGRRGQSHTRGGGPKSRTVTRIIMMLACLSGKRPAKCTSTV